MIVRAAACTISQRSNIYSSTCPATRTRCTRRAAAQLSFHSLLDFNSKKVVSISQRRWYSPRPDAFPLRFVCHRIHSSRLMAFDRAYWSRSHWAKTLDLIVDHTQFDDLGNSFHFFRFARFPVHQRSLYPRCLTCLRFSRALRRIANKPHAAAPARTARRRNSRDPSATDRRARVDPQRAGQGGLSSSVAPGCNARADA